MCPQLRPEVRFVPVVETRLNGIREDRYVRVEPRRRTASCSSSQLLAHAHPRWRAFSLAASQARLRNSLKVIEASGSSEYSSIASKGASCLRYFALKQVPRRATRM